MILSLKQVDSTNTYAKDRFDELADGTLVIAETQTAGRGRLGRKWLSPPGNIYASYVVKQPFGEGGFTATCVTSLAVVSAVREILPDSGVYVKWPNDVFVGEKKLCGILCEGVIRHGKICGVICGVGVNVNMTEESLMEAGQSAISLQVLAGEKIPLKNFIKRLAFFLNRYYITGISFSGKIHELWKRENLLLGKTVELKSATGTIFRAKALDIEPDGRLLLEREDGKKERFSCGDVKIIPGTEAT